MRQISRRPARPTDGSRDHEASDRDVVHKFAERCAEMPEPITIPCDTAQEALT